MPNPVMKCDIADIFAKYKSVAERYYSSCDSCNNNELGARLRNLKAKLIDIENSGYVTDNDKLIAYIRIMYIYVRLREIWFLREQLTPIFCKQERLLLLDYAVYTVLNILVDGRLNYVSKGAYLELIFSNNPQLHKSDFFNASQRALIYSCIISCAFKRMNTAVYKDKDALKQLISLFALIPRDTSQYKLADECRVYLQFILSTLSRLPFMRGKVSGKVALVARNIISDSSLSLEAKKKYLFLLKKHNSSEYNEVMHSEESAKLAKEVNLLISPPIDWNDLSGEARRAGFVSDSVSENNQVPGIEMSVCS